MTITRVEQVGQPRPSPMPEGVSSVATLVRVCVGSGGMAAGAPEVIAAFERSLKTRGLSTPVQGRGCECSVQGVGCLGLCAKDVLVEVVKQRQVVTYERVKPSMVDKIVEEHIAGGEPVGKWVVGEDYRRFHDHQTKILLGECGAFNPERMEAYVRHGGYQAARKALASSPEQVLQMLVDSGLRGRGGAGFPTGLKWTMARNAKGEDKYLICNADEGDPGAFMDRALLEGNPHGVLEGMLIGAWAMGATEGIIYVRAEYPLAASRMRKAIDQAREAGLLGKGILGTTLDFDVLVRLGAGAFVCGEETALIASLEDRLGTPRPKPPFPVDSGLWGCPTVINNVETWATVPHILRHGPAWFRSIGTEKSPGTKIFSLVGKVKNTGLVEVPMGMTLREIVMDIGGGVPDGGTIKAVQTGGPSGGCIPAQHLDVPVDYERLAELGSIMGSGGMVVMDEATCMVDVARFFVDFCREESCGQCTACREGTAEMVRLLDDIREGRGTHEHIDLLEELVETTTEGSLCGLGKTAANPVRSTLRFFRDEVLAHVQDKRCPAGVCRELISFTIDESACTGCTLCARDCPTSAITGAKNATHRIDASLCVRCGMCLDVCRFDAVRKLSP